MSDIRFNRWSHSTGTGGIFQDSSGRIGIGSSVPKTTLDVVGIVSATGAVISGVSTFSSDITISNGNIVIGTSGKGIDFSANANAAGMTSELLDDYEEGTWTPIATSSSGSITSYVSGGNYTKIGDTVRVNGYINITNQGSAGGQYLNSSGLPFTSSGGIIPIGVYREQAVNGFLGTAQITDGSTTVYFLRYDNSGQIINGNFHFTITYKTST